MTPATPGFPADPWTDTPGYTHLLDYLQTDPAWGGAPKRPEFSTEPEVGPLMGSQPSVPVVPPVTSFVGSQPRFTTMEPPNASTDPTGLPTGSATQLPCPDDRFDPETVNYDTILQLVLVSLNRPDLYTQEVRQPLSVWDVSSGRPVQPGVRSLALDWICRLSLVVPSESQ